MHAENPPASALHVAVFARAPVPGVAKTRLIPRLGADGAAQLQARLIEAALAKAKSVPGARVALWLAGDPTHPFIVQTAQRFGVTIELQVGADLGARMAHAFATTFATTFATRSAKAAAAARCLLIGTDCPALTPADLARAADTLNDCDVVIQPALDGGYVLLGLRIEMRAAPPTRFVHLFDAIEWGGPTVLSATRARIAALGLACAEMPPLPDLDTADDYDRACAAGWLDEPKSCHG